MLGSGKYPMLVHWKSAAEGAGQEAPRFTEQTSPLSVVIQFGVVVGHVIAIPDAAPVQNFMDIINHHFNSNLLLIKYLQLIHYSHTV